MRRRLVAAAALAVVAIGSVGVAWSQEPPALTAADAAEAAEGAFEDVGIDAALRGDPSPSTYVTSDRGPVDVWLVLVAVRDELVQLQLARDGTGPVFMDDRTIDGSRFVLSRDEYESVARHIDDPALARTIRRNIAITIAAVLVVALAIALAATAPSKEGPAQ